MPATEIHYNVHCLNCDQVWVPGVKTPLWWEAKQRSDKGFLDALRVTGEECGCIEKQRKPDAPFRVFGYDDTCCDFNIPFTNFTAAVRKYRELDSAGCTVYITGVSEAVKRKLKW